MNIELTKTQRLLLCGSLIGLASLMLQACETVMKENEDVREKICGNWQSAEAGPDILVYKEGEHYKVTLFRRSGVRRRLKPETYLLQREENGNLYMNTGFRIDVAYTADCVPPKPIHTSLYRLDGSLDWLMESICDFSFSVNPKRDCI